MRMRLHPLLALGAVLGLASCGDIEKPPSTAVMPAGALGTNGDIDVRSLDIAAFDFAHAIRNNPGKAAEAIAALDYMGGELNSNPRWIGMDPLTRLQMLQAREKIRDVVGISQAATSQAVVDTMLALGTAYQANDQATVQKLLTSPIFTIPPAEVQARLNDIPYNASINNVTTRADGMMSDVNVVS